MGYDVHAVTGKDKNDYLKDLGAKNIIDRKEFEGESKLRKGVWDGVVDTVGGFINQNICSNKTWWDSSCLRKCWH